MMAAMPFRLPDLGPDKRRLLGSGLLAFGLVGMALSLYGPAFPALQGRFDIGAQAVGLIVSLHFLGGFVAVVTIGPVIARLGYRRPLASAAALAAVGSAGVALGPGWELVLLGAFLLGLGLGFLDIGLNLLLVRSFDEGGAPVLNLLHALFGLGAVLGPALMAAFIPRFGPPFVLVAFASLALVPLALGLTEPPRPEPASGRLTAAWGRMVAFVLLFFLYVAVEVGVGSWETEHLAPAFGPVRAAAFTSLFWAALTVGRLVAVPVSAWLQPRHLMLGAAGLSLVALALAQSLALAPYAYALVGFALAPVFPTGLVWLKEVFPGRVELLTPVVLAIASLAPVLTAPLIGMVVEARSSAAIPTVLMVLALLLLLLTLSLWARTRSVA